MTLPARQALDRLRDGNRRFTSDTRLSDAFVSGHRRAELAKSQEPFAIILGCSDSRVPAEIVFDQGLGDLFVIRVAGNIVAPSRSAASSSRPRASARGWSSCSGTLSAVPSSRRSKSCSSRPRTSRGTCSSIVDRMRPSIEGLLENGVAQRSERTGEAGGSRQRRASVDHLRHGSEVLEQMIEGDGLVVVGAEYSLETGEVEFFHE